MIGMRWSLAASGAVGLLVAGAWLGWSLRQPELLRSRYELEQAKTAARQAEASAEAALASTLIIDSGMRRNSRTLATEASNREEILAALGAETKLDADLVLAARRRLCRHQAYVAGAECAGLRSTDPAKLPDAGSAGSDDLS